MSVIAEDMVAESDEMSIVAEIAVVAQEMAVVVKR
jgi:hypothetical protein